MTSRNGRNVADQETMPQFGFALDDPDSRTRSPHLQVVYAEALRVETFTMDLFGGFTAMRALTYTSSIPMVLRLLRDYDYDDFECVFGHGGVLSRDAADLLAFQSVVQSKLNQGFVGAKGIPPERREVVYRRAAEGSARFLVVKDAIAHAKIYLLEREGKRRVIVGSANLSETAFSGRQAETVTVFDDDPVAWEHFSRQYEDVRSVATSNVPLRAEPLPGDLVENTPALRDAGERPDGVTIFLPAQTEDEVQFNVPHVLREVERIAPVHRQVLADLRPDRKGMLKIVPQVVKQMTRIATARHEEGKAATSLSYDGRTLLLSGQAVSLETDADQVASDVAAWLEFFGNYENGFVGDVPRMQRDYFTFMCWFYFSPWMCDLRNAALRANTFSFDRPMFAIVYGESNCGKSSLIETLMTSMFDYPRIVETPYFTRRNLRALQAAYQRFPVVFDDIHDDRFRRHAPEVIKDEHIPYAEYPCIALSMNADARNFQPEIVKRSLMIWTTTSLPGDAITSIRQLRRSVTGITNRMSTALYRRYLAETRELLDEMDEQDIQDADVLEVSSSVLCRLFEEHLPPGAELPEWCAPMTLHQYQNRAFEQPRSVLEGLIHPDKYTRTRRPGIGDWTIVGDQVIIGIEPLGARRIRDEIPNWILNRPASISGQIVLKKETLDSFLGQTTRPPRRFRWF